MEVAVLMADGLDIPVDGEPVGVDIEQRHEDGDHDALLAEVLILVHRLTDDHLAVGRGHDDTLCVAIEIADGTAEEIDQYRVDGEAQRQDDECHDALACQVVKSSIDQEQKHTTDEQRTRPLVMEPDLIEFPYAFDGVCLFMDNK